MKYRYLLIVGLCVVCLAVMPAQAFTAKTLTITLDGNGNAQADMQYELSFTEQAAIFFHAADPATALQSALQENLNGQVTVQKADMSSADVVIDSFATLSASNGTTTMTTPAFSFASAQAAVKNQWYAPLISADFAPQATTITFPDGYKATYFEQINIPSVSHQLA